MFKRELFGTAGLEEGAGEGAGVLKVAEPIASYGLNEEERIGLLVNLTQKVFLAVERDRSVVVHAPASAPDDVIHRMVESKRPWIHGKISHKKKYDDLPHPPGKELVSGESALYLGRQYRIEMVASGLEEI